MQEFKEKKISIITVVKNAESTIERSIQSVLNQNYSNIEHIIVNGYSTDKTNEILGSRLNTMHNLYFYLNLMQRARDAIQAGSFAVYAAKVKDSGERTDA